MDILNTQKGQSLIEIIFAIAIFAIGVITIGYLIIDGIVSLRYATESTQARFLAEEGIEAVSSIRDGDFSLISAGTYGLVLESGVWTLVAEPDEQGKFTRTITITDVGNESKEVSSVVAWNVSSSNTKNISYTTRLTDWKQTAGQAGDLSVSIDNALLSASGTELTGLTFQNTGADDIFIDKISVTWSAPALLERIVVNEIDLFNSSTSAPVSSESEVDIEDFQVRVSSGTYFINTISFDRNIVETNFIITFTLADGSKKYTYISL